MKRLSLDAATSWALALFSFTVLYSVTAVEASLFLALIFFLVGKFRESSFRRFGGDLGRHPLFRPWMIYLGVCLLTAAAAYYPKKGFGQLNSDFLKYVCLATLLLTVVKARIDLLSRVYASAAAVSAAYGIGQVLKLLPINRPPLELRAGAFMSPVRFGEVMAIALGLLYARLLFHERGSRRETLFYGAAAILVTEGLLLSQSRGAYLGFSVFLGLAVLFSKGRRVKALLLAAVMMGAGFFLSANINPAVASRFTVFRKSPPAAEASPAAGQGKDVALEKSAGMRLELWKLGLEMFRKHPFLGIGPDNIKPMFTEFRPNLLFGAKWGSLHNLYVQQAAERGILGLAALGLLFSAFFLFALKNFRAAAGPSTLWALCVLPAFYAMNLTEISFQHVHTSFAVFLAMALSAAAARREID